MRYRLLILLLASMTVGYAQFVVEKSNGEIVQLDGNVLFAKDPATGNWSVGEVYDEQLQLGLLESIRLADRTQVDTFANKSYWVYGIKAPKFPGRENLRIMDVGEEDFPEGVWMRLNYEAIGADSEKQFLTWSDSCGWYDCNKTYQIDDAADSQMCWAATASNLLHWWLVQNAAYIARYDEKFGQEYDFQRPSVSFLPPLKNNLASNKSEIFNFFIDSFRDRSGWSASGVNWFICGNSVNISAPFKDPAMASSFMGFFPEVFDRQTVVATDSRQMTKENFNRMMKEAFAQNKAIGVVVSDFAGAGSGSHAMTIWGAEFDADGYVSNIYYVDNNMIDQDPNGAAIYRYGITYQDNPYDYSDSEVAYFQQLPRPYGGRQYTYLVSALILVDLCKDQWEAAVQEWDSQE